jgi:hypothetical protein
MLPGSAYDISHLILSNQKASPWRKLTGVYELKTINSAVRAVEWLCPCPIDDLWAPRFNVSILTISFMPLNNSDARRTLA